MLKSPSHNRTEERELRIRLELSCEGFKKFHIHSWNGDHREELVDSNNPECDEDFLSDMFCCPDFSDIGNHRKILRFRVL